MKRMKKMLLAVAVFSATAVPLSCSSSFLRPLRDAAIDGTAAFVENTTLDLLGSLNLIPEDDG